MQYVVSSQTNRVLRIILLCLAALLLLALRPAAQNADEQAIRKLVAEQNSGKAMIKYTNNRIFVSGAFARPSYQENDAAFRQVFDSISRVRTNQQMTQEIKRLEVAASGEMAYEVGEGRLQYDANGKHEDITNAYVRVWRKVDGQWLADVLFVRPNRP